MGGYTDPGDIRDHAAGDMESALTDFILADSFPENHLIGKDPFNQGNPRIYYGIDGEYLFYKAMALQKSGRRKNISPNPQNWM